MIGSYIHYSTNHFDFQDSIWACISPIIPQSTKSENNHTKLTASGYYLEEGAKYAYVGGLVGRGFCEENCTNYIDINYTSDGIYVGGLVGYCDYRGTISVKNLVNKGAVSGSSYVGGVWGTVNDTVINGCYAGTFTMEQIKNEGAISGSGDFVGGHAGHLTGEITGITGSLSWMIYDGQNSGNISGNSNVGGLFGGFYGKDGTVTIDGCTSSGTVSGTSNYGEIIGLDETK